MHSLAENGKHSNHSFAKTLILFYFFSSLLFLSSVSGEVFYERLILLQFKYSVSDPYGLLSGWRIDSFNYCSWFGISCDSNSRVSSISIIGGGRDGGNSPHFPSCSKYSNVTFYGFGLRRNCSGKNGKLGGKLSFVIGKLTELRVLSLPFNELTGEIPREIWGLRNLQVLDLEGNLISGYLPHEFTGLRKLHVLNLGFNGIVGEIPTSLSKCRGLRVLNLAGNQVNGTIPGFVVRFSKLKGLYLSFNRLVGSVPDEWGNHCQNLEHLDLAGNLIKGKIPHSLGNCSRLRTLVLFSNMLDGVIPHQFGQLRRLEVLDVSRNTLGGPIPVKLGNCVKLSVLVLSSLFDQLHGEVSFGRSRSARDEYNFFEGSIPVEITVLPKLKILWAPNANLEGKFPSSWGHCDSLEMVNLAQNSFTGEISGVFGRCKNLHFLNLSSNKLTGKLDEKLQVSCMTLFDVSDNLMSGSIPNLNCSTFPYITSLDSNLGQPYNPAFAYLSFFTYETFFENPSPLFGATFFVIHNFGGNNFSGPMPLLPIAPERLEKRIDYAFLAGGNNLSGSFPENFFGKCNALNGMILNVSNNNISGQIPSDIGVMCRCLKFLDASKNQISGSIPQSLGDLKSLIVLDLSRNKLHDPIPVGLWQLKYLKYFSLTGNNLTGIIPSISGQLKSLKVLEHSSNSLSGEIPQGLVNSSGLTVLLLDNKKLSLQVHLSLPNVTSLSTFNVSFNNLSGPLRVVSLSVPPSNRQSSNELQNSTSGSGNTGFNSIQIASIITASAIFSVLLALVILFFYTRKWIPNSRVQVSEPSGTREITIFNDIGVPLTFENVVRATGNFNTSNCIGGGGFGSTYKAEVSPGTLVAVKRLTIERCQGIPQFHAEISTLGRIRHPHLITLIGYHASEAEMFLIYNYLPGGNLENFIRERARRAVGWKILHKIALDIASALAYLHDQCNPRVLHRDVKPSNILLDDDFNAYLSDFGLSRLLGISETHATTGVAGTFGYVAPEYALTCRVSEKADVYSYGVALLELISDKKALDPSFSSHANGFNIVSWACMLLRQGQAKDVFTAAIWDAGPHDNLVDILHLAIMCTAESFSTRPTMKQVVKRLKQLQPPLT